MSEIVTVHMHYLVNFHKLSMRQVFKCPDTGDTEAWGGLPQLRASRWPRSVSQGVQRALFLNKTAVELYQRDDYLTCLG